MNYLTIQKRIGIKESDMTGMDTLEMCEDIEHFRSYPKSISYRYNSKGFRDNEWPTDLSEVVWCVGDSFTVGIGQPFQETWPQLLQKKLGKTCLNLGEDGCANDTMALRAQQIYKLHNPHCISIMWSYLSRRRVNGYNVAYDKHDFGDAQDLKNFIKNFETVNNLPTVIYNLMIPGEFKDEEFLKSKYPELLFVKQLDYARDYWHFDVKTSTGVSDWIAQKYNKFDKSSK